MWRQTWGRSGFSPLSQEFGQVWKESISLQEVDGATTGCPGNPQA